MRSRKVTRIPMEKARPALNARDDVFLPFLYMDYGYDLCGFKCNECLLNEIRMGLQLKAILKYDRLS